MRACCRRRDDAAEEDRSHGLRDVVRHVIRRKICPPSRLQLCAAGQRDQMCEQVRGMCSDWAASIRTACGAIGFDRSTFHYKSRRTDQAAVEKRIREICGSRARCGYRRVHVIVDRDGWRNNIKNVYRSFRDLGMQLRNKAPKQRCRSLLAIGSGAR